MELNSATPPIPASPTVTDLLAAATQLAQRLALTAAAADRDRRLPFEAMHALRELRLGALRVPLTYGGAGGSWRDVVRLFMTLASGDSNVAQAFLGHVVFIERLRLMGSSDQWRRWLPLAASGVLFGGAAAERGSGFRGELQSRLLPESEAGRYRLNGTKHYSTGALFADILKIRALDVEGRMISVIVPADRAGIQRIDDWNGMGQRGTASGTTLLQEVSVAHHEILPMWAWTGQRHHTGAAAQILHCAIDAGIALAALRDGAAYLRQATHGNCQDAAALHALGRMAAGARAAEALVLSAADELENAAALRFEEIGRGVLHSDSSEAAALSASIATAQAKIVSTEAALEVTQQLVELSCLAALATDSDTADVSASSLPEHHWRNARTHTTHDPVAYKCKALGDYLLNATTPPLTFSY